MCSGSPAIAGRPTPSRGWGTELRAQRPWKSDQSPTLESVGHPRVGHPRLQAAGGTPVVIPKEPRRAGATEESDLDRQLDQIPRFARNDNLAKRRNLVSDGTRRRDHARGFDRRLRLAGARLFLPVCVLNASSARCRASL
jgi:hypothetical protein